jgi:hypothetical protein
VRRRGFTHCSRQHEDARGRSMTVQDGTEREIYLCAAWPCQNADTRGRSALERDLSMCFRHHEQTRKSASRINVTSQGEGAHGCLMDVWDGASKERMHTRSLPPSEALDAASSALEHDLCM